jgi:squalene-hopene/tetraprenyl-beta-curcumene cyclase
MAFAEVDDPGRYGELVERTVYRLKAAQWNQTRGCEDSDPNFGGVGYNPSARPDLYHTSLVIESLHGAGVSADDDFMRRAVQFVSRCQNLDTINHVQGVADDAAGPGGFSILPAAPGGTNGAESTGELLEPCGSLTCAGLKSLIYCGVPKDDGRVVAALDWLRRNYSLSVNPGMSVPRWRLYDYWYSWSTAMTLLGEETIVDGLNIRHDWRRELVQLLRAEQQPDGCWINPDESESIREAHPVVTTSLAILTLCRILDSIDEGSPPPLVAAVPAGRFHRLALRDSQFLP